MIHEKCNLNDVQVGANTVIQANTVAKQEVFVENENDEEEAFDDDE